MHSHIDQVKQGPTPMQAHGPAPMFAPSPTSGGVARALTLWLQTERSQASSNIRTRAAHDDEIGASTASASPAAARGEARNAEPAQWRGSTSVNVFRDLR